MSVFIVVCFVSIVMNAFEIKEQREKSIVCSMECRMQKNYLTLLDHKQKITFICLFFSFAITNPSNFVISFTFREMKCCPLVIYIYIYFFLM